MKNETRWEGAAGFEGFDEAASAKQGSWLGAMWERLGRLGGRQRPPLTSDGASRTPAADELAATLTAIRDMAADGTPPDALFAQAYYQYLAVLAESRDQAKLLFARLGGLGAQLDREVASLGPTKPFGEAVRDELGGS
jgi:hypothetical protein